MIPISIVTHTFTLDRVRQPLMKHLYIQCIALQFNSGVRSDFVNCICYHTIQDIMALTSLPNAMWMNQTKMLETNYPSLFNTDSSDGPL